MKFVYEEGEEIPTGSSGLNDFVLAAGEQIPDTGLSSVVFEAGVGIGADGVIANGTEVGYYESNETWESYSTGNLNIAGEWGYQSARENNIVDNVGDGNEHYAFIYHNTKDDIWSVGYITNQSTSVIYTFGGGGDFFNSPSDPDVFQEDEAAGSDFGVDGNGDPTGELITSANEGDAVAYSIPTGGYELTVEQESSPDSVQDPSGLDFAGPGGRVFESFPASIDVIIGV